MGKLASTWSRWVKVSMMMMMIVVVMVITVCVQTCAPPPPPTLCSSSWTSSPKLDAHLCKEWNKHYWRSVSSSICNNSSLRVGLVAAALRTPCFMGVFVSYSRWKWRLEARSRDARRETFTSSLCVNGNEAQSGFVFCGLCDGERVWAPMPWDLGTWVLFYTHFIRVVCLVVGLCVSIGRSITVSVYVSARKDRQAWALRFDLPGIPARNKSPPWVQ